MEAAKSFPPKFQALLEAEGYTHDQVFNVDETGIFWLMPPTRTIKRKTKEQAKGLKLQKTRCSLMLGSNASGDLKLKPVLIHTAHRPRAFAKKHVDKKKLPVYW